MSVADDPRVTEIMQAVSRYGKLRAANAPIVVTDRAYRTVVELVIQAPVPGGTMNRDPKDGDDR